MRIEPHHANNILLPSVKHKKKNRLGLNIDPLGKPKIPHLLRCQGLGAVYYSLTLGGRLGSAAPSTFATLSLSSLRENDRKHKG
jgi:hypothetical protein